MDKKGIVSVGVSEVACPGASPRRRANVNGVVGCTGGGVAAPAPGTGYDGGAARKAAGSSSGAGL